MPQVNVVLTGFMGTGKSAAGRFLAARTERVFVDTDELIVRRSGRSLAAIFEDQGEAAFREMESLIARELADRTNCVIATGGRLMLDPLNALWLGRNAVTFCLTAEPEEILARLAEDDVHRPLLAGPDRPGRIVSLLNERASAYGQFRQVSTSGKTPEQVASEIEASLDRLGENPDMLTSQLPVRYPGGVYEVVVGRGLLPRLAELAGLQGQAVIITDENVGPLYARALIDLKRPAIITAPAGEAHKNLATAGRLYGQVLEAGLDRRGTVVALGGGVIGDLAGFVAATYMRGVELVHSPTTLLAMVDASVGGKTGVDLPQGKNLVGAFKQPQAVIADLDTLQTLPEAEFVAGLAEVVKAGFIASPGLLEQLEKAGQPDLTGEETEPSRTSGEELNAAGRLLRDPFLLQALIVEAILIKRGVVEADPFEAGLRQVLNLGHTFAHAIEQVSGYTIRHGEAVAIGLVATARLSAISGYCSEDLVKRSQVVLSSLGLPTRIPANLAAGDLLAVMARDKKTVSGQLRFVLLRDAGDVFASDTIKEASVLAVLRELGAKAR